MSTKSHSLWIKHGASYVRCIECTHVYENPRLTQEELKRFYSDEKYFIQRTGDVPNSGYINYLLQCNSQLQNEYFDVIEQHARVRPGRFLDVGCGSGGVVATATRRGWEAMGQEISDWAAEEGRKNGINIINVDLLEARLPSEHFDAISMFDVLEHLPSPVEYLREIFRILKPNGVLVIETPNINGFFARWFYKENSDLVKPRAHISLFTPRSTARLCEQIPFSHVRIVTFPYCRRFSFTYFKGVIATHILPGRERMQLTFNESLRIVCWK